MASTSSFMTACKQVAGRAGDALGNTYAWVRDGGRKRQAGVGAVAVAAAVVVAAATMSISVSADEGIYLTAEGYPAGTTAIADESTVNSYTTFPTGIVDTSYNSTQYAGRLWTDKTVIVPTDEDDPSLTGTTAVIPLADSTRDLDGDGGSASPGQIEVDKTDSGVFLTCISALSSSLSTRLVEPVPLDIVMVLDVSGSMNIYNNYTLYTEATAPSSIVNTAPSDRDQDRRYFIYEGGEYKQVRSTVTDNGNRYYYNVVNGTYARYYYTTDEALDGTQYGNNSNYRYARLYRRYGGPSRISDLRDATNEFLDTISTNNSTLANLGYTTDSMSQIAIVAFSGPYNSQSQWPSSSYTLSASDKTAYGIQKSNKTNVVTGFTTYTDDGITGTASVNYGHNVVDRFIANHATAADFGMKLAGELFDGNVTLASDYGNSNRAGTKNGVSILPARKNAKKVVIFFTDGNPKHDGGTAPNDFQGLIAQNTIAFAEELKAEGTLVYTVAMIDGADPNDLSLNVNIYLNGVSSNYTGAYATGGTTGNANSVSGLVPPSANVWTVDPTTWEGSNQGYYLVVGGETSISDAFAQIASEISSDEGGDSTATGRDGNTALTITDYLGDYMEFKGLDGVLYGTSAETTQFYAPGTQGAYHTQAQVQRDDMSATQSTYTMWIPVPSALLSPPEGEETVNLNLITVKVTRSTDARTGDTVTVTIPPELIPSLRYAVEQQQESGGTVSTTSTRTDADPLRIFYSVGPKANTLSGVISQLEEQALRSENATNESDRQSVAYRNFLASAADDGSNGIYSLYNNTPTQAAQGTTTVAMTLAKTNPYYFYVDEPLYVKTAENPDIYRKATQYSYTDSGQQLYVLSRYWSVPTGGGTPVETKVYVPWNGTSQWVPQLNPEDGIYYVPEGMPRLEDVVVTNVTVPKGDGNLTNTATDAFESLFSGATDAQGNYVGNQYLGNNGRLDIPIYGTLAVTKNITAGEGFDLPTDPVPSATFTLSLSDAEGHPLTEANTYRALIRDSSGHPIDPATHATVTSADSAKFYVTNGSTFELRDGETIKITNLPNGATYQVTEDGQAGYQATVTDNTGYTHTTERGASASTTPAGAGQ